MLPSERGTEAVPAVVLLALRTPRPPERCQLVRVGRIWRRRGQTRVRIQKQKEHEREAAAETDRREVAVSWETGLDVAAGAWLQPVGV